MSPKTAKLTILKGYSCWDCKPLSLYVKKFANLIQVHIARDGILFVEDKHVIIESRLSPQYLRSVCYIQLCTA